MIESVQPLSYTVSRGARRAGPASEETCALACAEEDGARGAKDAERNQRRLRTKRGRVPARCLVDMLQF